jgi:hypothetical protein
MHHLSFRAFGQAAFLLAAGALAPTGLAQAQVLDRIDVTRTNGHAEIRIEFGTQVQYLSHTPLAKGKELNIFLQVINSASPDATATEELLTAPKTDIVPAFTVIYPRLGNAMSVIFAQETTWEVKPGADNRSLIIVVPVLPGARDVTAESRAAPVPQAAAGVPAVQPATPPLQTPPAPIEAAPVSPPPTTGEAPAAEATGPTVPALSPEQIESMAKGFFDDARKALAEKDMTRAINRLNRTLGLPNNQQTEAAQALIGEVREMNGEIAKARAEYDLYLKLYPKGADAQRIRDKLANLPKDSARVAKRNVPTQRGPAEWTTYGSIAQYYYTGKSHIEITTPPPPGLLDFTTDVLSLTDQKALITNLDLNARRRDGITDTRIVVRETDTRNYLNSSKSYSRLYSAYVEQSDRQLGYFVRAGRQTPTGGGVMERFDGLNVGYTFADRWRVNGVAGYPVEFMSPFKKDFYGVSLEMQPQPEEFGFTGYALSQRLEGVANRQAVGIETRRFDMNSTLFGMLDYDTIYRGVNIAMLQGNYRSDDGTNYFIYIDHRKTPPYSLTNALPGLAGLSIKDAITTMGIEQLRADAKALTATSDMLAIGFTYPWSPRWMFGADYRAAAISSTQATATMPAMAGSGTNHVFSVQAIGTNLMGTDVGVINASYIKGATYNGQALSGNYVYTLSDAWRLDTNLRYYTQKDNLEQKQVRVSPSFKVSYRWDPATIEGELGAEDVKIDGPMSTERSNRKYVYFGYRLDLR